MNKKNTTDMAVENFVPFAKKESELTVEEKQTLGSIQKMVNETVGMMLKGMVSSEDYEKKMNGIEETLKSLNDDGKFGQALKDLNEYKETIKEMAKEIEKYKQHGFRTGGESPLAKKIDEFMDSEKFKDFLEGKTKSTGRFEINLKDTDNPISLTDDYTGDKLITRQSNRVVTKINEGAHLRDIMTVDQGDPAFPTITFTQITDLDRNAAAVSENGRLPESSFKLKEVTTGVCRIGTFVPLSKRLLKSRTYVRSWLLNRIGSWVRMAEDFQIMFGDGQGDNLKGIANQDGIEGAESIIGGNIASGEAGSIKSISTYNSGKQSIIEFKDPHPEIMEGQKITFAASTAVAALNETFEVHKVNDRKIMIDFAYQEVSDINTLVTFTVKNSLFNSVASPTIGDAVNAIFAIMTYADYAPTFIAMNPSTVFEAETAKDTTGRSLNLVTMVNGVKYISGRPIIETTKIAPGKYFAGDMTNGASLVDWTSLTIEFAEDVETKLRNSVVLIAQEEVQMPVYNPYAFTYGNIADVITAITKS